MANPPYLLDASERAYRHGGGMLGAGLSLAIVDAALERLEAGGSLLLHTGVAMVEGGDPFLARIRERLASREWEWDYQELDPDVFAEELDSPPTAKPSGSPWSACGSLVPPEALQAFHQILVQALPASATSASAGITARTSPSTHSQGRHKRSASARLAARTVRAKRRQPRMCWIS